MNTTTQPRNGLRFLDSFYSDGLGLAAALTNAQATYANARLATASEFDDLLAASSIAYNTSLTASASFDTGEAMFLSSGLNYDAGVLRDTLGQTGAGTAIFWTDPDGNINPSSTLDVFELAATFSRFTHTALTGSHTDIGWLLVSDAAAVPVPAAGWLFMSALLGLVGKKHLSR